MSKDDSTVAKALFDHPLYKEFVQVKNVLASGNHICWIAGGAVRDLLLGRMPFDFDLVTDATTEEILALFPEALSIGASFGVVKLKLPDSKFFDLATFRRESDYIDGRRPSRLDFATPAEDALRRDFTINALFWDDVEKKVVDFTQGLNDLEQKIITCVGRPDIRFQEDHLRILRLLRFSVQLQFKIEEQTLVAAISLVKSLEKISGERIWAEWLRMSPFIIWSDFFKNDLARAVVGSLFPIQLERDFHPDLMIQLKNIDSSACSSLAKFFYVFLRLTKSADLLFKFLKTRLKLSRNELAVFIDVQYFIRFYATLKINEWVYEIEQVPALLSTGQLFFDIGLFPVFDEVQKKFLNRPAKLITGNDLIGKVEHVKMAEVLKKIRLLQFEQPSLSKQEIFNKLNLV